MPAFSGKYYYTVDPKGRIIIPAPFREIISVNYSPNLYITNAASERCLHIYPFEEWGRLLEKVKALPRTNEHIKYFARRVIASAVEMEVDKQGRILIPSAHRQDSEINGEVVIVGQIDKIELWDRKLWDGVTDISKIDIKAYEAALSDFGL
ncbi:MAG: division/cell wall cluster transcriptional repressor MraZ [Thermodesulfovibrionales bacterium]|nr:division/cell wall cluster transcriptional repressor MraZ [Thermodesulfovibrionales bacterium]